MQSSCVTCDFRPDRLFCDMPAESLKAFDEIKSLASYPKSTVLFAEGRPVRGIYILCDGRARLSICSDSGKTPDLARRRPGRSAGTGSCPLEYPLRDHRRAAGQLAGGFRPPEGPDEVPAREPRGLPAGRAHVEPGPARRLRTGAHHRHDPHPPSAMVFRTGVPCWSNPDVPPCRPRSLAGFLFLRRCLPFTAHRRLGPRVDSNDRSKSAEGGDSGGCIVASAISPKRSKRRIKPHEHGSIPLR